MNASQRYRARKRGEVIPLRKPGPKRSITVDTETGCHIPDRISWSGSGYPQYKRDGHNMQASRVVWIETHGEIPDGLQIDHLCRNPKCVNVEHFELVTCAENVRRSTVAKLTQEQVAEIRASDERLYILAERYGVTGGAISMVRNGKTWAA